MKTKEYIYIEAYQQVTYYIGLEIGEDISKEDADEIEKLDGEDYFPGSKEWYKLHEYLTPEYISDQLELEDVSVYKKQIKINKQ